jgi:hypothetical protein
MRARKVVFENVQKSPARILGLAKPPRSRALNALSARTLPARRLERFSNHISSPFLSKWGRSYFFALTGKEHITPPPFYLGPFGWTNFSSLYLLTKSERILGKIPTLTSEKSLGQANFLANIIINSTHGTSYISFQCDSVQNFLIQDSVRLF